MKGIKEILSYYGKRSVTGLAGILFVMIMLTGCVEEVLEPCQPTDPGENIEGFSIGFTMSLPKQDGTRAYDTFNSFEDYENYIDTKDMLRIFFFDKYGRFLFGAIDRTVTPLGTSADNSSYNWYVRIPVNYIVDREGTAIDVNIIRDFLRKNDFKVAVLANWPNKAVTTYTDDEYDEDGNLIAKGQEVQTKDEPLWDFSNSILNPNAKSEDIKNINDLHHLVDDGVYNKSSDATESYGFIMENNMMGQFTDWVEYKPMISGFSKTFNNQATAEEWIRTNWNPGGTNSYRHYQDLWFLWQFGSTLWNNTFISNSHQSEWESRNSTYFYNWLNTGQWYLQSFDNKGGLKFVSISGAQYSNGGVKLPPATGYNYKGSNSNDKTKQYIDEEKSSLNPQGYFKFMAPATGTYRIKFSSATNNTTTTLVVQRSTNQDKTDVSSNTTVKSFTVDGKEYRDLSITADAEPIYIWCQDNAAIIYSIEWICSKYLSDTDRKNKEPSADNPIPMYGVQNFPALGDYWEEGTTFNLSDNSEGIKGGSYEGKTISLIRSLAKVEVYIKKSLGNISHMLMRSCNRKGRCEPMDVESPTETLWKDHDNTKSSYCEFFDIQKYGPGYDENNSDVTKDRYKNYLSWFYGSWKEAQWKITTDAQGNVTKKEGWSFTPTVPTTPSYPHLFNPMIDRSDFAEFLTAEPEGEYNKYVFYMPDKNIDDPGDVGNLAKTPKVPHIEYRFGDGSNKNTDTNLDDNDCHRIYFTSYATGSSILGVTDKTKYEEYEQKKTNLQNHWPVMRNHVYQFYVGGNGVAEPAVKVNVSEWGKHEKVVVDW